MQVKEIMTPKVEFIDPEITISEAAKRLKDLDVGILPVGENDRLVGMLTDRDIAIRAIADGQDPTKTKVRDTMTSEVVFCFDDQEISDAAKAIKEKKIRRLVVLNRDKRLVGICSLGDLAVENSSQELSGEILQHVSASN